MRYRPLLAVRDGCGARGRQRPQAWRSAHELEAVLAHELTHIRNRDTQPMVIAVIFAGIFAFFGD